MFIKIIKMPIQYSKTVSFELDLSKSYTERSSYNGYYVQDMINFGNDIENHLAGTQTIPDFDQIYKDRQFPTVFGCVEKQSIFNPSDLLRETNFFFDQQADGILGIGVHTDSMNN